MSEARDHELEIERLDRESPGWDARSKIATARHALEHGVSREVLLSIYGEEIVAKADPSCRREGCGHLLSRHTERSVVVGDAERTACSVDGCDVCSRFIDEHATKCPRCGDWDGQQCICYAR